MQFHQLVADVGGTNIRLALINPDSGKITAVRKYLCSDYANITDVVERYLEQVNAEPKSACFAIASPVDDDWISMTNHHWRFSVEETRKYLGFQKFSVINDYTAIAMAVPRLEEHQKHKIGQGAAIPDKPIAVCGPGTGLGVALLVYHEHQWICLDGEGGHVDFAPQNELEDFLQQFLRKSYGHVSAERVLTGPGLVNIYRGIKTYCNEEAEKLKPADITRRAVEGNDERCSETLQTFCSILGSFAGNLAITAWTTGGVYIAGGIAPKMTDLIAGSNFRKRFEAKGRFQSDMGKIPTYIITEEQPGLIGAAETLIQQMAAGRKR